MLTMSVKRANHALVTDEDAVEAGVRLKHNLGIAEASHNPCPCCSLMSRRHRKKPDKKSWKRYRRTQFRAS